MSKAERRIRDFSYGIKKLSENSRNYIYELTYNLSLVNQSSAYLLLEKKYPELVTGKVMKHGGLK
jgi:hypothetical protein